MCYVVYIHSDLQMRLFLLPIVHCKRNAKDRKAKLDTPSLLLIHQSLRWLLFEDDIFTLALQWYYISLPTSVPSYKLWDNNFEEESPQCLCHHNSILTISRLRCPFCCSIIHDQTTFLQDRVCIMSAVNFKINIAQCKYKHSTVVSGFI